MASRLPISKLPLPKMTMSRFPLSSNKENKVQYCFRAKANKGAVSEAVTVELNFHSPISKKYRCVLCHQFLLHPCQVTCCGSFYCKDCIDRLSTTSGKCANKKCGKNYSIITDGPGLEDLCRKMQQLKVYCLLKSSGCKWVGTVAELEQNHFVYVDYDEHDKAACQFQDSKCPNQCGATLPRGKMAEHRLSECERELSLCEYCGMEDSSYAIFKVHQRMCLSMPVECPNKCGIPGIARSAILSHLENECPLRLASCKYRHVGCDDRVRFTNLEEHNTSSYQKHLDLMTEKLEFVSNENAELREVNDKLQREVATLISELRDAQQGFVLPEYLLDDSSGMSSAHGTGGVGLADSLSLSSLIDTVVSGGKPKQDVKSGYESVIDELCSKIASDGEVPSISSENQVLRRYMSVESANPKDSSGAPTSDGVYEVLPDLCANVPQSQTTNETSPESSATSGDSVTDNHRYATVTRKVAKSTSQHETEAHSAKTKETSRPAPSSDPSSDSVMDYHRYATVKKMAVKSTSQHATKETEADSAKNMETSSPLSGDLVVDDHRYATVTKKAAISTSLPIIGGKAGKFTPQQPEGSNTASQPAAGEGNIELLSYHRFGSDQDPPSDVDNISCVEVDGEKSGESEKSTTLIPVDDNKFFKDQRRPESLAPIDEAYLYSGPPANPQPSVSAFMIAIPRPRSAAISAPSLQYYNPRISEVVKARRRRTPPLPPAPTPPELPPKRGHGALRTESVPSSVRLQPTVNETSDSVQLLTIEPAPSKIAPIPNRGKSLTTTAGNETISMGIRAFSCTDIGPTPVSVDVLPHTSPQQIPFKRAQSNSEATALFEPLSSLPNNSPTMSETIMKRFPKSGAHGEVSTRRNGQPDSLHHPEQASSWHSTLVGAIRSSYRTLHQSLQSGSTYSLPAHEAKELKKDLKVVLKKRSSVLCD